MPKLFDPIQVGSLTVKNRVAFAPTGTGYAHPNGSVSDQTLCHYVARSKGGAGWITIEHGLADFRHNKNRRVLAYDQESFTVGLRDLVEVIHAFGAIAVVQLGLGVGRQSSSRRTGCELVSASPIPYLIEKGSVSRGFKAFEGTMGEVPRELSIQEIRELEESFVESADRIKRVGFDGIEIHGAHGYLLSSFPSPRTNQRQDEYGGSLKNRLRLPSNLIEKTRQALGKEFLLGYRISGDEHVQGGLTLSDTIEIVKILADRGLDFIHLSSGSVEALKYLLPDEEGIILPEAIAMKRAVQIPVICPNLHSPDKARKAIEDGQIDMVSLSRPLLADPEWPNKVAEGREKEIRRCKRCNQCLNGLWKGFGVRCSVNPFLGRERFIPEYWPIPRSIEKEENSAS